MGVSLICEGCGRGVETDAPSANQRLRCRECGALLTTADAARLADEGAVALVDAPAEGDDFAPIVSRPRRTFRPTRLIPGILLLLVAVGLAAAWYWSSSPRSEALPDEVLRYLPDDFEGLRSFRLEQVRGTRAFAELEEQRNPNNEQARDNTPENFFGVPGNTIVRITLAGRHGDQGNSAGLFVIQLRHATTLEKVSAAMLGKFGLQDGLRMAAGRNLYQEKDVAGQRLVILPKDQAYCMPHERLLLKGTAAAVEQVLRREGPAQVSSGIRRLLDQADFSQSMVFLAETPQGTRSLGRELLASGDPSSLWNHLLNPGQSLEGCLGLIEHQHYGRDVVARLQLFGTSDKAAEQTQRQLVQSLNERVMANHSGVSAEHDFLRSFKISRDGATVTVQKRYQVEDYLEMNRSRTRGQAVDIEERRPPAR